MTTTELVERVRAPSSNDCADMDKLLVVFVVLGGHVEVAELKYQHNKVSSKNYYISSPEAAVLQKQDSTIVILLFLSM